MNSLILTVFFTVLAQDAGAGEVNEQEVEVVDVTPEPAYVTVEVPTKIKKAYAYIDRVAVVEVNKQFEVPAGKHEVVVIAPGYYDLPLEVNLKPGEKKKLRIRAMMPGYSTLKDIVDDAGRMIYYSWSSDWPQTAIHPWKIDGNSIIIDGNPLPGGKGMGLTTYNQYRSSEFVFRFCYRVERGKIDVVCNGKRLPASRSWHSVIVYAAQAGSYMLVDWAKYPLATASTNISLKWKQKTSGRIVFKDFSFTNVAKQKAEAAGD